MLTGMGLNHYDHSSMEHYGATARYNNDVEQNLDLVASSKSEVVGLQSMFRLHRKEMMLA